MRVSRIALSCALALAWAATAFGQAQTPPLADRLPAESLLYLGWGGADANQAALKATGLGQVLDDPEVAPHVAAMFAQFEAFLQKQLEQGLGGGRQPAAATFACPMHPDQVSDEPGQKCPFCGMEMIRRQAAPAQPQANPAAADVYAAARALVVDMAWRRPWAVALIDLKMPGPDNPAPKVEAAFVADLGDQADAVKANLDKLLATLMPPPVAEQIQKVTVKGAAFESLQLEESAPPILWGLHKKHLLVTLSTAAAEKVISLIDAPGAGSLATNAQFAKVAAKAPGGLANLYVDLKRFRTELLPMVLAMTLRDPAKIEQANKLISAMGLDAIDALGLSVRAEGDDFATRLYLLTPNGKPGALVLADQKPVNVSLLEAVPSDATFALLANVNRVQVIDELERQLAKFPEAQAQFNEARAKVEQAVGLNLKTDVAAAIGDGVAVYNSPNAGGFLVTGLTIVAEVRDHAKLAAALPKLETALLNVIDDRTGVVKKEQLFFKSDRFGRHEYRYLAVRGLPVPVAPAWCLTDKYVVISTFPQTLKAALLKIDAGRADSLLTNERFARRLAAVGEGASSVLFVNNRQLMRILYPALLPLWQVGCSMAAGAGVELDVNALPRQATLLKLLGDDVAVVVPDAQGVLFAARGPTPISGLINGVLFNPVVIPAALLRVTARPHPVGPATRAVPERMLEESVEVEEAPAEPAPAEEAPNF